MKTLKDFSAFKLNKNQMGAMKGGAICVVNIDDYAVVLQNHEMSVEDAEKYVADAYGQYESECFPSGMV